MIRQMYLKKSVTNNSGDFVDVTEERNGLEDSRITSKDHGSQRSLFRDKMKDKECACM